MGFTWYTLYLYCTPYSVRRTLYGVHCTAYSIRTKCTTYSARRPVQSINKQVECIIIIKMKY